ncbi:hypothetical protein [Mesoplasma lactucae]|uniref:hypothetical protein n=2 Tax=Mesoplasma lactucae TaxID=138853 RepID=UPI000CA1EC7D|nr:hypothetical protein [Mesoplasma lactucae]ATZ20252.1 hypothetical protein MLACT_v1c04310 [Mesoplasma lactucae ATCC 49193]MCL8216423.1 hypothetical protein [Mesoplasma lactucae ATCC 49193]
MKSKELNDLMITNNLVIDKYFGYITFNFTTNKKTSLNTIYQFTLNDNQMLKIEFKEVLLPNNN